MTMSRLDCISNRNFKILTAYLQSIGLDEGRLFDGLSYPEGQYESARDFFLDEDEWTTYENFETIFRRARKRSGDPAFYFRCGASSGPLRSWGRFNTFVRIFATPNDGFRRLPFFNRHFNDTKEIEIIQPPAPDPRSRKIRTLLKVRFHEDVDPNRDYIGDPLLRGILSSIPAIWGKPPALIRQPLNPYDPVVLFNEEPEFKPFALRVRREGDALTLEDPDGAGRVPFAHKVCLVPEIVQDRMVFLGRYTREIPSSLDAPGRVEAFLITRTVCSGDRILVKSGEIFQAPYFVLEVTYEPFSLLNRFTQFLSPKRQRGDPDVELSETVDQLRHSIAAKNDAFRALEKTNAELREAKLRLDEYAQALERKVEERTSELQKAREELLNLNRNLEARVRDQLAQLQRYNALRRYLSPNLAEQILAHGGTLDPKSRRRMMTVVFSDIRGFSDLADSVEPEELFHLMDRYLGEMIRIVHRCEGTLNKIIGDGLLVFFGDPVPVEDHARRAVSMAVQMQRRVEALRAEWRSLGHELAVGIGINTGYMTVGSIGPDTHKDYTVIGNQVNIASRLESLAQGGQILISERTYALVREEVRVEQMGEVRVKGIHSPVMIYNVVDMPALNEKAGA
ncbi:MAG: hypothetical protein JRF59_09685 [Deltaproteobacteria bacterium]|nr:hypothetical protein [Deltaproteobacteria bacterium]MBW1923303.1 hypothetical protein [Deltaproteobacteria bacterium]MBW1950013.1 hypothetical protein [Deltaproteobacteria bacterium]MBW2007932.1 hypothetical protein [Deltaproteobacteria bacterium]MBW2102507.1 hypothetical protein [Deltaproteobacteria bacterium]